MLSAWTQLIVLVPTWQQARQRHLPAQHQLITQPDSILPCGDEAERVARDTSLREPTACNIMLRTSTLFCTTSSRKLFIPQLKRLVSGSSEFTSRKVIVGSVVDEMVMRHDCLLEILISLNYHVRNGYSAHQRLQMFLKDGNVEIRG